MEVKINIDWEKNYGAWAELLPGCVAVGDTLQEVKSEMEEAIKAHLKGMREDGEEIPKPFQGIYKLSFKMNVRALLHTYKGVISNAGIERLTGINRRQLTHYYSGLSNPKDEQCKKIEKALHKLGKDLIEVEL